MTQLAKFFTLNPFNQSLRSTIDLSFAYVRFDTSGVVQSCNENFTKTMGYDSPEEIVGLHHQTFVSPHYATSDDYAAFWDDLRKGTVKSGEFKRVHKSGKSVFIRAAYTPQKNKKGEVVGIIKIALDVTQHTLESHEFSAIKQSLELSYAFIMFDTEGNIKTANDIFVKTMGYESSAEVEGKHHSIFVEEAHRDSEEYRQFWEDLGRGVIKSGEYKRYTKTGQWRWLQSSYSPVKDVDGKISAVIKIATDITDQKTASDLARDLKSTVDQSFGYIRFDPSGTVNDVNDSFATLIEYEKEEIIGAHHSKFVDPSHAHSQEYADFWEKLRNNESQHGQFSRISKSGNEIWIQAAYTPAIDEKGNVTSVIKVAADITSNKREAEEGRREVKDSLLSNIREIASAVSEMAHGARDQAEKIDLSSSSIESSLQSSQTVSDKADQIAQAANKGKDEVVKGSNYVNDLVSTMSSLSNTADQTQVAMEKLTKGSEEISSVLGIIQEIANNTNLLALNASIEAAQAGDAGRGFSVIAHEIRMLAESARDSVKQIENQISSMKLDTKEVSNNMDLVADSVRQSKEATNKVSAIFNDIVASNEQTSSLSSAIVNDSEEQKNMLKQLVGSSEEIVVISEQTAAGTEEVAAATKALEDKVSSF